MDKTLIFEDLDNPYKTTIRLDDDGIHIIVETDILQGEDPTAAKEEANRRALLYRKIIENMIPNKPL